MELNDWLLLKTLYREKSTSKVADSLFLSQPAVLYRINQIEKEFQTKLFVRSNKGILFTEAGRELLSFADDAIRFNNTIKEAVCGYDRRLEGEVKIGASSTFMNTYMMPFLEHLNKNCPGLSISLTTQKNKDLIKMLKDEQLLMAVIRGEFSWTEGAFFIYDDPFVIISSFPITPKMLIEKPIIRYSSDPLIQKTIQEWIDMTFDVPPIEKTNASQSLDPINTCIQLVLASYGWSVVPYTRTFNIKNIYIQPIRNSYGQCFMRRTRLLYHEKALQSPRYATVIERFREFFANYKFPTLMSSLSTKQLSD